MFQEPTAPKIDLGSKKLARYCNVGKRASGTGLTIVSKSKFEMRQYPTVTTKRVPLLVVQRYSQAKFHNFHARIPMKALSGSGDLKVQ